MIIFSEIDESLKRRCARQASEKIRNDISKYLEEDDDDSSEESVNNEEENYKKSAKILKLSLPPSLTKRTLDDLEVEQPSKKMKPDSETVPSSANETLRQDVKNLVKKVAQEDIRRKLRKLTPTEMEALLIQKVVECITVRGELGKLRDQVIESKKSHEATRNKCKQLQKQVEAFDLVLKRMNIDRASNEDKYVPPIKVHRSVGLQVNLVASIDVSFHKN